MNLNAVKRHRKQFSLQKSSESNSFKRNFQEYMADSNINGLKYVGDTSLSMSERIFFILAFLLVSALSTYFISIMWIKWTATPVIISNDPLTTSIKQIPFPATTICNMNQAMKRIAKDITPGTIEDFQLKSLCMRDEEANQNFTWNWAQYKEFVLRTAQPCEDMLIMCKYGSVLVNCSKIFETSITDDGLCCSFNRVHPKFNQQNYQEKDDFDSYENIEYQPIDWNPEIGFGNQILNRTTYPRVALAPGASIGLKLILNSDYDDYYCSSTNSAGFKLLLHNPIETPLVANYGILIKTGYHTRLAVTPQIPSASPLIRTVAKYKRQCMFTSDANLTYFRSYTKKNCELECKSRIIEAQCGCVLHYMPRFDENTKICSQQDSHCYKKIKFAIESPHNTTFSCTCLPGCFAMTFYTEMSMSRFNVSGYIKEPALKKYSRRFLRENIAMVDIFYDDSMTRKNMKSQFVGFTDFLSGNVCYKISMKSWKIANVTISGTGGLLNLFMGFSIISIIEILYYATLRPYCKSKRLLRAKSSVEITIGEPRPAWKEILNILDQKRS